MNPADALSGLPFIRSIVASIERPLAFKEPSVHGDEGVEVINFGAARWVSLWLVECDPPLDLALPLPIATTGGREILEETEDRLRVRLGRGQRAPFNFLSPDQHDEGLITLLHVGQYGAEWKANHAATEASDRYFSLVLEVRSVGHRVRRVFRLRSYQGQERLIGEARHRGSWRDLSTLSPGGRWALWTAVVFVAVAGTMVPGAVFDSLPTALARGGLILDAWGVVMLAWSAFRRVVLHSGGMVLGGGSPDGDDQPEQRATDRDTVRAIVAVGIIVMGFSLQLAGQSV